MNKIIEKVLEDLADMQLNLQSDVARTWIAQKVEEAMTKRQEESDRVFAEVMELTKTTTLGIDDIIITAMADEGYVRGDSGYDLQRGVRDITFHDSDNNAYEVTFRKLEEE